MNVEERGEVIKGREIGDLSQPSMGRPGSGCLLQSKCNFRRARGGYKKKRGRKLANLETLGRPLAKGRLFTAIEGRPGQLGRYIELAVFLMSQPPGLHGPRCFLFKGAAQWNFRGPRPLELGLAGHR